MREKPGTHVLTSDATSTFLNLVAWTESIGGTYDIVVCWTPEEGVTVTPPKTALTPDHIRFYTAAGS